MTSGGHDGGTTAELAARIEDLDDRVSELEVALDRRLVAGVGGTGERSPADPPSAVGGGPRPEPPAPPTSVERAPAPEPTGSASVDAAADGGPAPSGTDWSRLPAWAGAVVTVGGVVMLVVLAASAGWFAPAVRVSCGALLGVVLLLAGVRSARRDGVGTGACALAGTGVLALFSSIAAATSLYPLLPAPVGLAGCLAVAAGGMVLADRWSSRALSLGVLIAAEVTLPVVGGGWDGLVLSLALALQVGAIPTALPRPGHDRFGVVGPIAAAATAVHGLLAALVASFSDRTSDDVAVTAVAVVALAVGTAIAVLGARCWSSDRRLPSARGTSSVRGAVVTVALSPVPLLAVVGVLGGTAGAVVAGVAALAMAGVAAIGSLERGIRLGSLAVACLLTIAATAIALDGRSLTCALLAEALTVLVLAAGLRNRALLAAGAAFAAPGTLLCLVLLAEPFALGGPLQPGAIDRIGLASTGAALLVLVAAAGLVAARRNVLLQVPAGWLPATATALYGAGWLVVVGTQLILPGAAGFRTGHVLVTVGVTVLGLVLLARGLRDPASRWAGFVLVGAALVKLVLVDLFALDGMARVVAFLAAGLLLLGAGSRYARRVGSSEPGPERAA